MTIIALKRMPLTDRILEILGRTREGLAVDKCNRKVDFITRVGSDGKKTYRSQIDIDLAVHHYQTRHRLLVVAGLLAEYDAWHAEQVGGAGHGT